LLPTVYEESQYVYVIIEYIRLSSEVVDKVEILAGIKAYQDPMGG